MWLHAYVISQKTLSKTVPWNNAEQPLRAGGGYWEELFFFHYLDVFCRMDTFKDIIAFGKQVGDELV